MQTSTEMFYEHIEIMHLFLDMMNSSLSSKQTDAHKSILLLLQLSSVCTSLSANIQLLWLLFSWPGVNGDPPIDGDGAFVQGHSRVHVKTKDNGMFSLLTDSQLES